VLGQRQPPHGTPRRLPTRKAGAHSLRPIPWVAGMTYAAEITTELAPRGKRLAKIDAWAVAGPSDVGNTVGAGGYRRRVVCAEN
jgi:hypothetical protein